MVAPTVPVEVRVRLLNTFASEGHAVKALLRDAECGEVGLAVRMVRQGEDVESLCDELGRNCLHLAAAAGHTQAIVKLLACRGFDINRKSHYGFTALHMACAWDHGVAAMLLLDLGADPTLTTRQGKTAMDVSALGARNLIATHPQIRGSDLPVMNAETPGVIKLRNKEAKSNRRFWDLSLKKSAITAQVAQAKFAMSAELKIARSLR